MRKFQQRIIAVFIVLIVIAVGASIFVWKQHRAFHPEKLNMTMLQSSRDIDDFSLQGAGRKAFTNDNLDDKWTLLFFGFTNCQMTCPTVMAELDRAYKMLQDRHVKNLPQIVMVSIDPAHDDPDRVASYAKGFNSAFIGLGGEPKNISQLTTQLGIAYFDDTDSDGHSTMNHSGSIIVVDPDGELFGFYTVPHTAEAIADDLAYISKTL